MSGLKATTTAELVIHVLATIPVVLTHIATSGVDEGVTTILTSIKTIFGAVDASCSTGAEKGDKGKKQKSSFHVR